MIIRVNSLKKIQKRVKDEKFREILITSDQMYKIEDVGHNKFGMKKILMMENAGYGIAELILKKFKKIDDLKITVVCGTGNNGGDAMVASRHLSIQSRKPIKIIVLGDLNKIKTEEALTNFEIIKKMHKTIKIYYKLDTQIKNEILASDIIIDGIFGTGIKGDIKEPQSLIIDLINKSKAHVISVDIPSGLDPDTGNINSNCVKADSTITFHRIKNGLLHNKKYTGTIYLKKIGIPMEVEGGII